MTQTNIVRDGVAIAVWESDFADNDEKFHAVNMTECVNYGFAKTVIDDLFDVMGDYCRLIDECKLVAFGATQEQAIVALLEQTKRVEE